MKASELTPILTDYIKKELGITIYTVQEKAVRVNQQLLCIFYLDKLSRADSLEVSVHIMILSDTDKTGIQQIMKSKISQQLNLKEIIENDQES